LNGTERARVEDVQADLGGDYAALQQTVQELISLPGSPVKVTTAELKEVDAFRTRRQRPTSRAAMVAAVRLLSQGAWTFTATTGLGLRPTLAVLDSATWQANLGSLGDFLKRNPNVGRNLEAADVDWALLSKHQFIGSFGGAAVIDDRIHIEQWLLGEGGQGFLRMAVHEAGHATFQRMLLTGINWSVEADYGNQAPDDNALEADGQTFYQAWQVIRQKPQFFFVVDMPGDASEATGAGRQGYLARKFSEFCADSFMHLALKKADLQAHVQNLPGSETDVRKAWHNALAVLLKYEGQILGGVGDGGRETLVSHRKSQEFAAVLQELKEGLKGSELAVPDNLDAVKTLLERLRLAWQGMTPTDRARHRGEALSTLDRYILKVQRRRPAQANLGSELGFAGL
jgi:hypothetical protein